MLLPAAIEHHPPGHLGLIIHGIPDQINAQVVFALIVICVFSTDLTYASTLEVVVTSALLNWPNLPVRGVSFYINFIALCSIAPNLRIPKSSFLSQIKTPDSF